MMNDLWSPGHRHGWAVASLGVWLVLAASVAGAQERPAAPPEYGPVSISLEDVAYPFPVQYLPLVLYGDAWQRVKLLRYAPRAFPSSRRW